MYRGKHTHQERGRSKKHSSGALVLLLTTVLLVGGVVGGTVAWLIADTDPVVNTFTYGDINLKLEETETDEKGTPFDKNGDGDLKTSTGNEYEMVPGEEYLKDPVVTVLEGNEACWLFVKIEESTNLDDFITYAVADGWTALTGVSGVYYREVNAATANVSFDVLANNSVTVNDTVTKTMMNDLQKDGATQPTLTFTAYAVQKDHVTSAADAWAKVSTPAGSTTT